MKNLNYYKLNNYDLIKYWTLLIIFFKPQLIKEMSNKKIKNVKKFIDDFEDIIYNEIIINKDIANFEIINIDNNNILKKNFSIITEYKNSVPYTRFEKNKKLATLYKKYLHNEKEKEIYFEGIMENIENYLEDNNCIKDINDECVIELMQKEQKLNFNWLVYYDRIFDYIYTSENLDLSIKLKYSTDDKELLLYQNYEIFFNFDMVNIEDIIYDISEQKNNMILDKLLYNINSKIMYFSLDKIKYDRIKFFALIYLFFIVLEHHYHEFNYKELVMKIFFDGDKDFIYPFNMDDLIYEIERFKDKIKIIFLESDTSDLTQDLFSICNEFFYMLEYYIV